MTFGEKLKKLLEKKGLTQEEFAEMMGVKPPTVCRWVNDERRPRPFVPMVRQMAQVLKVPFSDLDGSKSHTPKPHKKERHLLYSVNKHHNSSAFFALFTQPIAIALR